MQPDSSKDEAHQGRASRSVSICLYLFIMKSSSVVVHCKPVILESDMIREGHLYYTHNTKTGEIDVWVDDVPYEIMDGVYQDPDEQLCEHYGIDYDHVNCIELA